MKQRRFTMIEMLVVIGILVILAGMTFGIMKMVWRKNADAKTRERIQKIEFICGEYYKKKGYYPQYSGDLNQSTIDGWADAAGVNRTENGTNLDFYKQKIKYQCPGTMNKKTYDIWSKGADKSDSGRATREKNDDLTNWKGGQ